MKLRSYIPTAAGHYRLSRGSHIHADHVVCDYPLRILRPGATAQRLLALCAEDHTPGELATSLHLSLKRVEQLCEQLRWKGLLEAGPAPPPESWPGVSMIIPSYNRREQLERCLRSLLQLEYPVDKLEIIVVDDCSNDGSGALIEGLAPEFVTMGIALCCIRPAQRQGAARGRNDGAEAARFDLLAYLDSDCVVTPGWLSALVPAFADPTVTAAGGQVRSLNRYSLLGRYEDRKSSLNMGTYPQHVTLAGPLTYLPTANLLVRREVLREIGGFAPMPFGEDVDFCRRLLLADARILYLPQGLVLHNYRTTLSAFLLTRVSYASAEAVLLRRHPATRRILLLPPEQAAFAGMAIGGVWGLLWMLVRRGQRSSPGCPRTGCPQGAFLHIHTPPITPPRRVGIRGGIFALILTAFITLAGARKRFRGARGQGAMLHPLVVLRATLRSHLAYSYHFCRHITRYYTLPLLIVGIIVPPLLLLLLILCGIVIGVDYVRLHPAIRLEQFVLYSLLDDCSYEVGVVLGSIKQRTWKPLIPLVRKKP